MRSSRSLFVAALVIGVGVILCPSTVLAQGAIAGQVSDSTGSVMPGVTVEASSPALIEGARSATTDGQGRFQITNLRPGTYTVTVSLAGFKTFVANEVRLLSNQPGNITATLEVGDLTEKVEVKAGSELVQTEVAARQAISELPTRQ